MERAEVPELNTSKNISLNEQYMILFESQNSQKKNKSTGIPRKNTNPDD